MNTEQSSDSDRAERRPHPAYTLDLPLNPRPIVILGAGGIVRDAHLPAYRNAGYPVHSLYNRTIGRAQTLADEYGITSVYSSLSEPISSAPEDAVFDIALMPEQYAETLEALPDGAAVLIQKPLGNDFETAGKLLQICRRKKLVAAVNTQLRYCPYVAEARALIASGAIGDLYDFEIRIQVNTPWEIFPNVLDLDRLEINMHSVHYIDLVRSFLGDPDGVSAVTERHPEKTVANTRSTIVMRYADRPIRVTIATNHDHRFGPDYEEAFMKWEGTKGAVRAQVGVMLDYPTGGDDRLEYQLDSEADAGWQPLPFDGTWFPDAFMGSMGALQRFVEGSIDTLPSDVEDIYRTMAVVEAAYESAEHEGVVPQYVL